MEVQVFNIFLKTDKEGKAISYTNIEPDNTKNLDLFLIPPELALSLSSCMKCMQKIEVKIYAVKSYEDQFEDNHFVKVEENIQDYHDALIDCSHRSIKTDDSEEDDEELVSQYEFFKRVAEAHTVHTCFVCGKKYTSKQGLAKHYENTTCERPAVTRPAMKYLCKICRRKFVLKRELNTHILESHPNGKNSFRCTGCTTEFSKHSEFVRHKCDNPSISKNENFRYSSRMNVLKSSAKKDQLKNSTLETFLSDIDSNNELEVERENKNIHSPDCEIMNESEEDDEELVKQYEFFMRVAEAHTKYTCFVCGKKYTSKQGLAKHYEITNCERPAVTKPSNRYLCQFCRRKFVLKRELKTHILGSHPNGKNSFRCTECSTEFSKHVEFVRHKCDKPPVSKNENFRYSSRMNVMKPENKNSISISNSKSQNDALIETFLQEIDFSDIQYSSQPEMENQAESIESSKEISDFEWPENDSDQRNLLSGPQKYTTKLEYELYTKMKREKKSNHCFDCKSKFKTVDCLNYHYSTSNCKRPKMSKLNFKYKCTSCSKPFITKSSLDEHKNDVHPKGKLPFYCKNCTREFEVKYLYDRHVCEMQKIELNGTPKIYLPKKYVCEDCNRAYRLEESYMYHRLSLCRSLNAKLKGQFYCSLCKRNKFMSQEELDKHKENVHGCKKTLTYECKVCEATFDNIRERNKHVERKHGMDLLCHMCSKKFSKKRDLEDHILNHEIPLPFICDLCGTRKKTRTLLSVHFRLKHIRNTDEMFKCSICTQHVKTEDALKTHMLRHNQLFSCPKCNKNFSQKGNLKTHLEKMHIDVRDRVKYTCDICSKVCFSKDGLDMHKLSHLSDSEKPFPCSYCTKGFTTLHQKQVHERIHTGERPYTCSECGKSFRHGDSLKTHIRTHTGEKPYECQICHKRFSDRGHRGQHYKQHEKRLGIKITGNVLEQYAAIAKVEEAKALENNLQ